MIMKTDTNPGVSRVIVIPLSGYINRIQSIASASILANSLGAEFLVCWESQNVAPAPAKSILNGSLVKNHLIGKSELSVLMGQEINEIPPYLTKRNNIICLAGLDRGEQVFMPELKSMIHHIDQPTEVVISAGGNFSFHNQETAITQRGEWYRHFNFADPIEKAAKKLIDQQDQFVGLHLRYTDRSHETPLDHKIQAAVMQQVERTGITSVFIASDTRGKKDKWLERLREAGLQPWSAQLESHDRANELAGIGAMVDWKVLGSATTSVYFAASSFGHEAAVMAGSTETSIALSGHPVRRWQYRGREWVRAAIHYPRNHWGR